MELTRRDLLKGAAALGAAAAVPLTAGGPPLAQTTQKKELVTAQSGDISKFDPHFSTSSNDIRVSFNVFDNLTSRHPDGKLYPGLATEWKLEGQTTWRFKLRQGVKFHNGDAVHLRRRQVQHRAHLRPGRQDHGGHRARHDREDRGAGSRYTLVITTKKPDPLLPARLAFYGGQIVPKKYLESVGNDTFNAKPVGTGPVRFGSWVKDDKAVLEANPDYWGGKIDVDRWIMRPIPETAPRIAALLKGEVDIITQLPPDQERAGGRQRLHPGGGRALRGPLRARGEQQAAAARQPAREAGAVARHRPRGDREGALARARRRAERPHREGRQPLRREPAPAGLQPGRGEGAAEEGGLQGRGDLHRDHGGLRGAGQGDVGSHRGHVEGRGRQREGRGHRVLGARPEEPREELQGRVLVGPDLDPRAIRTA